MSQRALSLEKVLELPLPSAIRALEIPNERETGGRENESIL